MKTFGWVLTIVIVAAGAASAGYWFGHSKDPHESAPDPEGDVKPVADVTTSPVKLDKISETITAYGTVVAQPGEVRVVSVPFESRVARVLVTAGQEISKETPLIEVQASPETQTSLKEAKNAVAAAERDLKQVQQRFKSQLATNSDLSTAQQTLDAAKLKLSSLTERGVGSDQKLKAEADGVVNKIDVQEGQIVPAGGPLVELASGNRIEVSLGVEPEDLQFLKVDETVDLSVVQRASAEPIKGRIRLIGRRIDPAARLATVLVTLPADAHLMLDTFVAGKIIRSVAEGLIVPREAVLPDEDGEYAIFTLDGDHAKKHVVHLGIESEDKSQIVSDEVKPGDAAVVVGNYTLEDGMEVHATAATSQPSTQEAARDEKHEAAP